ncbi:uncharacterized protein FPOAC1_012908 [Fusarium poae]|uniref:Uncharacterized protein n=1 Tax=Fusarium poae TaxID=36050 RepID=A0A1B8A8B8_FUSPO|nr:uncharacterized protein FPOAC1_012908 [Fusarium poae]KAG8664931.1 hypothetical protein FPOAC1_012908 [Fusarium poae]OBS16732.1 hypothetical protein FPOA_12672 [Fusarium poae]
MYEHDILLSEIAEPEDYVSVGATEESNDDGIESFAGTDFVDELYTNGGELDEHGVSVPVEVQATNKDDFKVDHSKGSFKMKPENFISRTSAPDFDAAQALEMFQRRYTIDYGRKASGSRAANPEDRYFPIFHLDMVGIVGRPLCPITRRSGFFDNVTFTLRYWHSSYAGKHLTANLPFDIRNRTFRIATAASREVWFIVMHPMESQMDDLSGSHGQRRQRQKASRQSSAFERHHSKTLAEYIVEVFTDSELLGEGVEPSWGLNDRRTSILSYDKWTTFQTLFMANWKTFSENHSYDRFWVDNEPAFHTYDCGANIEIEVNEELKDLPMETRLRSESEDENDSDSDSDPDSEIEPEPEPEPEPELASELDPGEPGSETESEHSSELEASGLDAVDDHENSHGDHRGGTVSGGEAPTEGNPAGPENSHNIYQEHLYSGGLEHLRTELEKKYNIDNIDQISYALAADVNCIERTSSNRSSFQQGDVDNGTLSLLADRCALVRHFGGLKGFTFYPLAFHPRYGNFSSPHPPPFLNDICLVMRHNMSYRNNGAEDVLSFGYFHAYSNIKRTIRHSPEDLLPARGIATGALTLPPSEAKQRGYISARQQRLLRTLAGEQTPDQPSLTMPFAREGHRIRAAMSQEQVAFRMEQVVTVRPSKLERGHRHFFSVLHPIFQLMRFFLKEKRAYNTVLRSFLPSVFPTILCSFAKLFELGLAEMHRRFLARAEKGLDLALSEAVAVLDRLGNYCFTGDTRVLMTTVFRPLLTTESLKSCAWPYVSATMLDFRGSSGKLDIVRWPRTKDEEHKPILLHIASLEYHYGRVVAANCHSRVWFGQLGAEDIRHVGSAIKFLGKVIRGFWVPQMVAFMTHQLRIHFNQGARSGRDPAEHIRRSERFGTVLDAWEQSEKPFSSRQFDKLFSGTADDIEPMPLPPPSRSNKARSDFASEIYEACLKGDETAIQAIASKNATWPSMLGEAIRHTREESVTAREWVDAIANQMAEAGIDWVPGYYCKRLTSRRIIQLERVQLSERPAVVLTGPPDSLKRAAMEAELRMAAGGEPAAKRSRKRKINIGCEVPITKVPQMILEGFGKLEKNYDKTDPMAVRHINRARSCLAECLGDPLCDMMLLLALTFGACTVTPHIDEMGAEFHPAAKRKDSDMLAATMVIRMLWFMRREEFPWDDTGGKMLSVGKMTQKIENRGFNNRGLLKLGWVEHNSTTGTRRRTPRTTELKLKSVEELYDDRKRLVSAMKNAEKFISIVFGSDNKIWVARCSSIIQDR